MINGFNELPARVVHQVKVVFHLEQNYECGHDLSDREPGERVLVAHDQQLTHLDDSLQLSRFVSCGLQPLEQLLRLARAGGGHGAVQDQVVHSGPKDVGQVGWDAAGLQDGLYNSNTIVQ